MLLVPTYLDKSTINGLGVFAAHDIKKDTVLWEFLENFDQRYSAQDYQKLPPLAQHFFDVYGYQDSQDGFYYLTMDNDRFTNHSATPNTYFNEDGNPVALVDIAAGDEITSDYSQFMVNWTRHFKE